MEFELKELSSGPVRIIEVEPYWDGRGYLRELYRQSIFRGFPTSIEIVQTNIVQSHVDVLRGLHFQRPPQGQAKIVTELSGKVYAVAVDLRESSGELGEWVSCNLAKGDGRSLFVPEGFAFGFVVTEGPSSLLMQLSSEYCPESAGGIAWEDPSLAIDWPVDEPVLSNKDRDLPYLEAIRAISVGTCDG